MSAQDPKSPGEDTDQPAKGNAPDALLRIGAGFAKVAAKTVTGKDPSARPHETPAQELMRHSATVAGTLLATTIDALKETGLVASSASGGASTNEHSKKASAQPTQPASEDDGQTVVRLTRDKPLRIPFSVDNRSAQPMRQVKAEVAMVLDQDGAGSSALSIQLEPETLKIAPHDFEKLIVKIAANEKAEAGLYTVGLSIGDDPIELKLMLE